MENPYAAQGELDGQSLARSKVLPAAAALIAISVLDIAINGLGAASSLWMASLQESAEDAQTMRQYGAYNAMHAVYAIPILAGAISMARLKSYRLATVAAWFSVIPFFGPCFVLGIPFGVWTIIVLRKPEVRAAFAANKQTA